MSSKNALDENSVEETLGEAFFALLEPLERKAILVNFCYIDQGIFDELFKENHNGECHSWHRDLKQVQTVNASVS